MKLRFIITLTIITSLVINVPHVALGSPRIKDIVSFEGIRENLLVGYGLVVGLNGTGDNLNNSAFTKKWLEDFLGRMGINTKGANLKTKNIAAVTVTATLPPFARHGSNIDISVSTLGDAKSLQGGMLIATPLVGADGEVYAVAQGAVSIGGFNVSKDGEGVSKGVSTNGHIPSGAIVEREIDFDLNSLKTLNLGLHNPDISTAKRIAKVINEELLEEVALAKDPGTVKLKVPSDYTNNVVGLLAGIERLHVTPDQAARVVVDEASGTIVLGENVRISTVAVAQGNLSVKITSTPIISQPLPFSPEGAQTVLTADTQITVDEDKSSRLAILNEGANLRELVDGLNALGVGPRDLINILQTIKSAGALQAEIKVK